jgi:glycosyltransferase involved in cell wall biosynthesis
MTDWPRISIVTPSYNQAQFLEQTICSVLDQGYPNLEYFVIDGGSTDCTVEIIRKYANRLTHWESVKDRGQVHAINKGLQHATGEILAYINSDDYYLPGAFECVAQEYMRQPFDLIAGACRYVDVSGNLLNVVNGGATSLLDFLSPLRYRDLYLTQPEVFWSRKVTDTCGLFCEDLNICFDVECWLRAVAAGFSVRHVDRELACFRRHALQKTNQMALQYAEWLKITREYAERLALHLKHNAQREIHRGIGYLSAELFYLQTQEAACSGSLFKALYYWLRGVLTTLPRSLWTLDSLRVLRRAMMSALHNTHIKK